ncbi:MAG: DUF115 domain-containing protein [Desulfobacterales bacterium]|nr:DUF115 domain-containing protein [Desulfobacterales bacterium]
MAGRVQRAPLRYRLRFEVRKKIMHEWPGMFKNIPCFLLGCGPSLNCLEEYAEELEDFYFTIGVNRAYKMLTPNILFFQDASVYTKNIEEQEEIDELARDSLILCRKNCCKALPRLEYRQIVGEWDFHQNLLRLHGSRTATPLLFQIACNLGFNPIIFAGVDCAKQGENFFGPTKLHLDTFVDRTTEGLLWCKEQAVKLKKEIICCSDNEILPYTPIEQVMTRLEENVNSREVFMNKLRIS